MSFFNKFRKLQVVRFYAGLIAVGLLFTLIGGFLIYKTATVTYESTEATIVRVEEFSDPSVESSNATAVRYRYFIDYEANGEKYSNVEFGEYTEPAFEGDKMTVYYNIDDPSQIKSDGSDLVIYVVFAVGIAALVFGIINLIKIIKKKSSDLNEYDRVDVSSFSQEQIDAIKNSTEPEYEYFFHYAGKFNQGYVLEDENKVHAYEANVISANLFKPYEFEFKNCITGEAENVSITHTVSTSVGSGDGMFTGTPINSSFKINGKNNWDYLAENGFSFDMSLNGISPCFTVKHCGVEVAYIKTEGTNVVRGKDSLLGKLPVNGIFSVKCRQSDIDMIFMVCVSIARAVFYEND